MRICNQCELKCRQEEWQSFTHEEKLARPQYATYEQVWKDQTCSNQGDGWSNTAGNIKKAKVDINEEEIEAKRQGTWKHRSHKQQKAEVLNRAQKLAEAFVKLLGEDQKIM
eukprot:11084184-Prorocentrum_lima.AAC.1